MTQRGRFITLEGGEGAGKSTQIKFLTQYLTGLGHKVVQTREPGGCLSAEIIRKLLVEGAVDRWDPISEVLMHFAARREHYVKLIAPQLEQGVWVISDRFADSTRVYQGYGQKVSRDVIEDVYKITLGAFEPDLTLILDLDPKVGLARAHARADHENRFEQMALDFHEQVRAGFLDIAQKFPKRCAVISAAQTTKQVGDEIVAIVKERLL